MELLQIGGKMIDGVGKHDMHAGVERVHMRARVGEDEHGLHFGDFVPPVP